MAARKKKPVEQLADPAVQMIGHARVRVVPVAQPVVMLTLGPEHGAWEGGPLPDAHGGIVRVVPPAQATDEQIGAVLDRLRNLGTAGVKLLPRATGDAVVLPAVERPVRKRHREVVTELVNESVGVDRALLLEVVQAVMDAEGL